MKQLGQIKLYVGRVTPLKFRYSVQCHGPYTEQKCNVTTECPRAVTHSLNQGCRSNRICGNRTCGDYSALVILVTSGLGQSRFDVLVQVYGAQRGSFKSTIKFSTFSTSIRNFIYSELFFLSLAIVSSRTFPGFFLRLKVGIAVAVRGPYLCPAVKLTPLVQTTDIGCSVTPTTLLLALCQLYQTPPLPLHSAYPISAFNIGVSVPGLLSGLIPGQW